MKVIYTLGIGFANAKQSEEFDLPDNLTDEELDADWQDWCSNYLDGGWKKVGDEE